MSWTIAQLLAIPIDEVVIQEPIEGTVKLCKDPTTHPEWGESQFAVIEDATGEVAILWSAPNKDTPLVPLQKGERVRIQATEYKGKLTGALKQMYVKNGEKKASIKVKGNRLTNLDRTARDLISRAPAPAASGPATPAASHHPAALMTEDEAVALWRRVFRHAQEFCDGPDPASCASTVLSGALAGMLRLDPPATTKAAPLASSGAPAEDDDAPPYDDDDLPFSALLPVALPLLYCLLSSGVFA